MTIIVLCFIRVQLSIGYKIRYVIQQNRLTALATVILFNEIGCSVTLIQKEGK
jgi:hypothetical protein